MDSTPTPTPPPGPPEAPATTAHHAKGWTVFPERGEAGTVLEGRFEVEKRIGRGGMAEVFLSKDLLLHGLVAVKVLREGNTDARRRFADEGRLLANLRDPHLVRVLAVGETDDGAPYMALEYLDGPSLEGRLRVGPLPWREVVDLAGQVAGALAALHRVGELTGEYGTLDISCSSTPAEDRGHDLLVNFLVCHWMLSLLGSVTVAYSLMLRTLLLQ